MRRLLLIPLLAALATAPAVSQAADPAKGTVSAASPKVQWKGTLVRPYAYHLAFNQEPQKGQTPCNPPGCDTFTLDVAEPGDVAILLASEQTEDISVRYQKPDGTWTYVAGWGDGQKATKVTIKKAVKGTYTLNVVARVFGSGNPTAVTDTADYTGTATLAVPAPPPAPAQAPPPPPPPPPAQESQQKPAPKKSSSSRAACNRKAKKIKSAKKRRAALKRCARRA
jgi:hypothetical protein